MSLGLLSIKVVLNLIAGRVLPALCSAFLVCYPLSHTSAADYVHDIEELNEISPRPGLIINDTNLQKYQHLLDPDFKKFIESKFLTLTVGEPIAFNPHEAFLRSIHQQGVEPYLPDTPGTIADFQQGLPFSGELKTNDPEAGLKLAWNMRYAYQGDNGNIPEMHWTLRDWRSEKVEFKMTFKAKLMRFMYRHVIEPTPSIMKNAQDAYGAFRLEAIDAGSYDGTQALVFVNRDESKPLNGWVYIPQLGRTQTLASFSREESMFGSDILPSDFMGYTASLTTMKWKFNGRTFALLPMYQHDRATTSDLKARKVDYWHTDFHGRAGCFPKVSWQLRETYILEGTAVAESASVSKRVLYVDAQTHLPILWKIYDSNSSLWKFAINAYAHPTSHITHNNNTGAPILTAFSTIDIQTNRCTTIQALTLINVDDISVKDFDAGDMQSATGRDYKRRGR